LIKANMMLFLRRKINGYVHFALSIEVH
jgi:hypothetical protein